jgi:hypothetical protein
VDFGDLFDMIARLGFGRIEVVLNARRQDVALVVGWDDGPFSAAKKAAEDAVFAEELLSEVVHGFVSQ